MLKYEYTLANSKNKMRLRHLLSILFLLNADSRKGVSKFPGLRWFLLFEDLYNEEKSLQANKAGKKH